MALGWSNGSKERKTDDIPILLLGPTQLSCFAIHLPFAQNDDSRAGSQTATSLHVSLTAKKAQINVVLHYSDALDYACEKKLFVTDCTLCDVRADIQANAILKIYKRCISREMDGHRIYSDVKATQ